MPSTTASILPSVRAKEGPFPDTAECMHRHTDGVAYNIIRYSGDVNGAIVCLGIRHGVASLIVVNGEMVVCMCPAVFSCLADRVYGKAAPYNIRNTK